MEVDESVGKWSVGRWVSEKWLVGRWSVGRWLVVLIKPDYVQDLVQSIPCKEEYSTITSLPDGTEINKFQEKIENLTNAITVLQLFVKEQFFIIKKHLEDMTNT